MRPGGGKAKGSSFERAVGNKLSMWISHGQRANLFARTVLSGGQFSNQVKKGDLETGTPGDLMANHPLAFDFMSLFNVECKHYADLGFELLLFDEAKSFLGKVLAKTRKECSSASPKLSPLVIAKQNLRPAILLCDYGMGTALVESCSARINPPPYHILHRYSMMMLPFERILAVARPDDFMRRAKDHMGTMAFLDANPC